MPDRRQLALLSSIAAAAMIAGCITVHVYFPVKELREAADEIVDDVRPDIVSADASSPENESDDRAPAPPEDALPLRLRSLEAEKSGDPVGTPPARGRLLFASLVSVASAEEKDEEDDDEDDDDDDDEEEKDPVIDASSPRINKIKATLKKRYRQLLPLYVAGRIGEGQDGYLALRDVKDLSLKDRRDVGTLLKAENADRKNLYTTIARENGIADSKIVDIGRLFGRSWQKKSKVGWWIEVKKGKWIRKPKPEKPAKSSGAKEPKSGA